MKSYKFEFYNEELDYYLHIITFKANLSEKQINEILDICRRDYRDGFDAIFKWYLQPLEYTDFLYSKEDLSYKDFKKRSMEVRFSSFIPDEYDYHFFLYFSFGGWFEDEYQDDYFERILFLGKQTKEYMKVVYQTDEGDEYDDFGVFGIVDQSESYFKHFTKPYSDDNEESNRSVLHCGFDEMFKLLMNIDHINTDEDVKNIFKA